MSNNISDHLLSQFSEFVAARLGLYFPKARWRELEGKIGSAVREFGFEDKATFIQWLMTSRLTRRQVEILASHLTVGETYFFREKRAIEILEADILPELIHSRQGTNQRLRIWSAGCCTGEEPYSIAISISKVIPDLKDWNITILATDINPQFLRKATEGMYGEWSFRGTPQWIRERYFSRRTQDGHFEILPAIQRMVTFSYLNLAEDTYPSLSNNSNAMDVIFCRNVLMYFAQERMKRVVQNFYRSLIEGGWLIVSPSEVSQTLFSEFVMVSFPGATFYKKDSQKSQSIGDVFSGETFAYASPDKSLAQLSFEFVAEPGLKVLSPPSSQDDTAAESKIKEPRRTSYQEGMALYEQGHYAEVVEKLVGLLSLDRAAPEAMTLLARAYANQGQLVEALAWCQKAIVTNNLDPGLHYLCATILLEQNLVDEAVAALKRALYLDPNFILAHFTLGNLALQQRKLTKAAKYFDNALSLLRTYRPENILPDSDGVAAGSLMEVIRSTTQREGLA